MTNQATSNARARRIRNALLAGVFTIGVVGATGAGALLGNSHLALADPGPVQVQAAAPADFSAVVEQVKPAVVSVRVTTDVEQVSRQTTRGNDFENLPPELRDFFRRFGMPPGFGDDQGGDQGDGAQPFHPRRGMSQGSGFFISDDGYVVTNNHVVEDGRSFTVITDDGRELDAKLIGTDPRTDLALLKVEGHDFPYAKLSHEQPKIGQWVLAVGNPFGLGGTVTAGIVSAENRDIGSGPYDNFLQIDAPVNRGNSGGPTFNTKGEVIGVNTAIFSPSGGNVGIAFAIPAKTVEDIVGDLRDNGVVTRGWLGVQIQPVTSDIAKSLGIESTNGAIVADAQANGPAAAAGIKAGDIITKVDGQEVKDPRALSETIAGMEPRHKAAVTVLRDGHEQEIEVTLGNLKDLDQSQQANAQPGEQQDKVKPGTLDGLGLTVEKNPDGDGVVVTGIAEDSPAADKGLQEGDVIVSVGGKSVSSVADLESGVSAARKQGRDAVLFKVQGDNGTHFVGIPFERG
jgi:serine protease Do